MGKIVGDLYRLTSRHQNGNQKSDSRYCLNNGNNPKTLG